MATPQVRNNLLGAFEDDANLANALCRILDILPDEAPIFQALTSYVVALKSSGGFSLPEHTSKKRKIGGTGDGPTQAVAGSVIFSYPDTSFSVPVRKKLRLEGLNGGFRALDASGSLEASLSWDSIDYVFCLPVPERAKPQHNFVVIPRADVSTEAIVWTAPEPNPKNPETANNTFQAMASVLDPQLARYGCSVIFPSEDEFVSEIGNAAKAKSFGTRAHRGSKEGHLFFLSPGILYGFKKPILFLPFSSITSISYTSVLQRTFNLVVVAREPGSTTESEIEFSMLDQADFGGIDSYIKRHGLNDSSLAESRRAKVYNVNASRGQGLTAEAGANSTAGQGQNGTAAGGDESELQKAERLLQDEEDEDEEDYVDDEDESEDGDYGENEEGEEYDEDEEGEDEEEGHGYDDDDEDDEEPE